MKSPVIKHLFPFVIFGIVFYSVRVMAVEDRYQTDRFEMVKLQIEARGVRDPAVLEAMKRVKRHEFVPAELQAVAYTDGPLPIGEAQTISQPYIVALMTELLELHGGEKILEIGTGSGYQAAVLAEIVAHVYTIEIIPALAKRACETLERLGYRNISVHEGDGHAGWPEEVPFDAMIVTAAPEQIPENLISQLKIGGRMVIPVGRYPNQMLYQIRKTNEGVVKKEVIPVLFVPMTSQEKR